jgi:hypothetical protein
MMPDSVQKQLIDLLERSTTEHKEYERSALNGVYDQEWDLWYAAWLVEHGINDLLNADIRSADLATLLRDINDQHQQTDKQDTWAAYTARHLVDTVSGNEPRTN